MARKTVSREDIAEILDGLARDLFIREHERGPASPRVDALHFQTLPDGTPDVRTVTTRSQCMMRGAVLLRWTDWYMRGRGLWHPDHE